ncbi:MAG TPA: methanol/ethanol family PQQ-dependent dehydrogenase [Caulobacteraceae bacterium]|jgi:PQQ-dependent dehydrogenase (methanol/ethanol family)|nr:methanol/ethanol family PQQ-dependent dehydrogenase [Caulobacteraceae bacterium]
MWRRISIRSVERRVSAAVLPALLLLAGCHPQGGMAARSPLSGAPVQTKDVAVAEDGQWPMAAKNFASTRYSGLNEINNANAGQLQAAGTFSLGVDKGEEAAPIVVNNTMYIVTAYPNYVYALDLAKPGMPLKWEYQPNPSPASQGVACCDVVNRGGAYANGKFYFNTLDGATIAVDAATGKEVWRTQLGDIEKGESITMAPLVVNDRVLVGNSGGEFGVRGWIQGLDAATGKVVWKAYHTGPDKDVLIGAGFHPFYPMDRGADLGLKTWPPDAWKIGGGTTWGWISYDPQLKLIYYGTGNPGPWNQEQRPGDNKWTAGIFARDPETGDAKWFYQMNQHDEHDYDGVNEMVLLDLPVDGQTRPVLLHPDRNGYLYEVDRRTGQVLSADPYSYINSTKAVDLKTGRVILNPDKETRLGVTVKDICPTASGAKDWQPSSWSPRTRLLYIPHHNVCMDWESTQANYIAGTPYVGAEVVMKPGPGGNRGAVTAWDPVRRRIAWEIREDLPVWSGTVTTAGDLVFYGTMDGWFKAVDARTGQLRWRFKCGSGIIGQPVVYRGADGHEYVAVLSGVGGWAGAIVSGNLSPQDHTSALGFVGVMADLKTRSTPGGMLYVFSLPH